MSCQIFPLSLPKRSKNPNLHSAIRGRYYRIEVRESPSLFSFQIPTPGFHFLVGIVTHVKLLFPMRFVVQSGKATCSKHILKKGSRLELHFNFLECCVRYIGHFNGIHRISVSSFTCKNSGRRQAVEHYGIQKYMLIRIYLLPS